VDQLRINSGLINNLCTRSHFEIPYDEAERAKKFYTELFGWKVEAFAPGMDYWVIHTQEGTGGGLMKRQHPDHKVTDYFAPLL
jgi:uncharacterized protein